jgi:hypothetical protein
MPFGRILATENIPLPMRRKVLTRVICVVPEAPCEPLSIEVQCERSRERRRVQQEMLQLIPPEGRPCFERRRRNKHGGGDLTRFQDGFGLREIVGIAIVERHGHQPGPDGGVAPPAHELMKADQLEVP